MALVEALQLLYANGHHFTLKKGLSYEIKDHSKYIHQKVVTQLTFTQQGDLNTFPATAKRLRISPDTIPVLYVGTPREKISFGAFFGADKLKMVGPHVAPSILVHTWKHGCHNLATANGNDSFITITEMVIPAWHEWELDFSEQGQVHKLECHQYMYTPRTHNNPSWDSQNANACSPHLRTSAHCKRHPHLHQTLSFFGTNVRGPRTARHQNTLDHRYFVPSYQSSYAGDKMAKPLNGRTTTYPQLSSIYRKEASHTSRFSIFVS